MYMWYGFLPTYLISGQTGELESKHYCMLMFIACVVSVLIVEVEKILLLDGFHTR